MRCRAGSDDRHGARHGIRRGAGGAQLFLDPGAPGRGESAEAGTGGITTDGSTCRSRPVTRRGRSWQPDSDREMACTPAKAPARTPAVSAGVHPVCRQPAPLPRPVQQFHGIRGTGAQSA